jgi:hypothetical protein
MIKETENTFNVITPDDKLKGSCGIFTLTMVSYTKGKFNLHYSITNDRAASSNFVW